jgi:deazaflavin-dependent oxidoreductase (nitroreductase family)
MIQKDDSAQTGLPSAMLRVTRFLVPLLDAGVPLGPLWLLETRGRKTGVVRAVPVTVARSGGHRWLVSIFGETGWVRNVRVSGEARLRRGRRVEAIRVTEVTDGRRAVVAMQLRRSFWMIPFVRAAFTATPRDGLQAFEAEAGRHPVFAITGRPQP